ncbi:MAG: hypothetical protein WBF42_17225 [Terracidiphilus sp.]
MPATIPGYDSNYDPGRDPASFAPLLNLLALRRSWPSSTALERSTVAREFVSECCEQLHRATRQGKTRAMACRGKDARSFVAETETGEGMAYAILPRSTCWFACWFNLLLMPIMEEESALKQRRKGP